MNPLITVLQFKQVRVFVSALAAVIVLAVPAAAQHGLSLSSESDFSTKDRLFADGESIYIKVEPGIQFDATTVTESSFTLEPARDGEQKEGALSMQDDGSFVGNVEVSALKGTSTAWHLRVKIEDELDHEYEARTVLIIRDRSGQRGVFRVSGTVDAATDAEISVGGYRIAVTSDTKLHAPAEMQVSDLEGRDVVVSVRRESDDTLTALQIFVRGDTVGAIAFVGQIQSVGDASIRIRGAEFAVNEHTTISSSGGEPMRLDDLEPRMHVRVSAQRTASGWLALSITVRVSDEDDDEDGEVRGPIDDIADGAFTVSGIRFEVSDRTQFDGVDGFDDLEVGMQVEIEFVTTTDGGHVALEVKVEDGDDDDDDRNEVEVDGLITAIGDREITVEGIVFTVTSDAEINGAGRDRIGFADLTTGLHVEVEGFVRDGVTIAHKIEVKGESQSRLTIRGEITSLGDRTVTVGDTEFRVTGETIIQGERGADLTFEDLEVGLFALVHLNEGADDELTAVRIKVKRPFEVDDVKITGRIEAVTSSEITVRGRAFSITADTEIEGKDGDEIAIGDLAVGMIVKIEGNVESDGTLVATEIKVRANVHQEGRFVGLVTELGDAVVVVNGVEFDVTTETIFEGVGGLGSLEIGTKVKIWLRRLGDGSVLALRIHVDDDADVDAEVKGPVEDINGEVVVVAGVDVTITIATSIEDAEGNDATAADLEIGQTIEVEGTAAAGGILATKIKIEDDVVVAGAVTAQTDNTINLAGITITIDGETLIIGRDNVLLTRGDLKTGAYIEVIAGGTAAAGKSGSTMTAERVLVMETSARPTASEVSDLPVAFRLEQNYPNPFNPTTNITFELAGSAAGNVSLVIFNVLGQKVATLVESALAEGTHTYRWNGRDDAGRPAASGIYLYRLRAGDQTATRSMILTK